MNDFIERISQTIDQISIETLIAFPATLVALLIPIAILIFQERDPRYDFSWIRYVLLRNVARVREVFVSLVVISLCLIFWNIEILRGLFLLFYSVGILFLSISLKNLYFWLAAVSNPKINTKKVDNFRTKTLKKFLRAIKNDQDNYNIWAENWQKMSPDNPDQTIFLDIYFEKFRELSNQDHKFSFLQLFDFDKFNFRDYAVVEKILQFCFEVISKKRDIKSFGDKNSRDYFLKEFLNYFYKGKKDNFIIEIGAILSTLQKILPQYSSNEKYEIVEKYLDFILPKLNPNNYDKGGLYFFLEDWRISLGKLHKKDYAVFAASNCIMGWLTKEISRLDFANSNDERVERFREISMIDWLADGNFFAKDFNRQMIYDSIQFFNFNIIPYDGIEKDKKLARRMVRSFCARKNYVIAQENRGWLVQSKDLVEDNRIHSNCILKETARQQKPTLEYLYLYTNIGKSFNGINIMDGNTKKVTENITPKSLLREISKIKKEKIYDKSSRELNNLLHLEKLLKTINAYMTSRKEKNAK